MQKERAEETILQTWKVDDTQRVEKILQEFPNKTQTTYRVHFGTRHFTIQKHHLIQLADLLGDVANDLENS